MRAALRRVEGGELEEAVAVVGDDELGGRVGQLLAQLLHAGLQLLVGQLLTLEALGGC